MSSREQAQGATRLLMVTDQFPPRVGGAGMVPEGIARALPDQVTVFAESLPANAAAEAAYDAAQPFRVVRVPRLYGTVRWWPGKVRGLLLLLYNAAYIRPRAWFRIRRALRGISFDVLCLNTPSTSHWLVPLLRRRRPGLPVVMYSHGEEWAAVKTHAGQQWLQAKRKADLLVVISSFTRQCAIDAGVDPRRIRLITNGVDTTRFSPGPPSAALRARYNLGDAPILLCLARLDERKGQDFLLRAMPLVLQAVPGARLALVGNGADDARLRSLAAELNLGDAAVFAGAVPNDEVLAWYRTATLYIMPNRTTETGDTEGFGLVFLEAGACGLPVIGGRAGGVPDAIVDGETGFLVDGRSVDDIASRCVQLLCDEALRRRMGRAGLAHAQGHTWQHQAALLLGECNALLRNS